jgi:DNA adenine methylase
VETIARRPRRLVDFTLHRVRRHLADVVSGYLSAIDDVLPAIGGQVRTAQILDRPALEVIETWDSRSTLSYCDPTYIPETRDEGSRDVYGVDLTEADQIELALNRCRGRVV